MSQANEQIPEYTLQPKYISLIRRGLKTKEGRIYSGGFKNLQINQRIKFFSGKNPEDYVLCQITSLNTYNYFDQMLQNEGVENMLPGVKTVDEGVKIYENIPSYRNRANKSGVISIGVVVLES